MAPPGQALAARQTPLPSHRPLVRLEPAGQTATHAPSAVPAPTGEHVPWWPLTLHDEQSVQVADAQQKPSTQLPVKHSPLAAHAWPVAFWGVQAPPEQKKPVAHEVVHEVAHWVLLLHRKPPGQGAAGRQLPLPSHRPLSSEPVQAATHAPLAAPDGTAKQAPWCPATLQAVQSAQAEDPQQTPSTQLPLAHSPLPPQLWPAALLHAPFAAQAKPAAQSVSFVHEVSHRPATHV